MNFRGRPTPKSRIPWLPLQLSSLSRHTGLPGLRLRPDDILIAPNSPAVPENCHGDRCLPLPTTYLTRRGELFLYTCKSEVQPWQSQVTPSELHRLADANARKTAISEGMESRAKTFSGPTLLAGILKQNTAFPKMWLSPARETIPPTVTYNGLTIGEFLKGGKVNRDQYKSIGDDLACPSQGCKLSIFNYEPIGGENSLPLQKWIPNSIKNRSIRRSALSKTEDNANVFGQSNWNGRPGPLQTRRRDGALRVPPIDLNPSNSCTENTSCLLSRSSLQSENISYLVSRSSSYTTDAEEFEYNSTKSDASSEWTYESSGTSCDEGSAQNTGSDSRYQPAVFSLSSFSGTSSMAHARHLQVNVNAVCPDGAATMREHSSSANQALSPSFTTVGTTTTVASSRWSRQTPTGHAPYSSGHGTPASTPSRKACTTRASLLETAKLLLNESSKLEPVISTREQSSKQSTGDNIGGGDAGGERVMTDRARSNLEHRRQREANELRKQITALDATIERLYNRTREKANLLHIITQETLKQIKNIRMHREVQRRLKLRQKRQITRELFLRHFRDRQARKRRLRVKLGLNSTHQTSQSVTGSVSQLLNMKEAEETILLKQWESKEDARDKLENSTAERAEEEAVVKATGRLRWLKEVAATQIKFLEEFIRVNHPDPNMVNKPDGPEPPLDTLLPQLRAKHFRLVSLLQRYGICAEDNADRNASDRQYTAGEGSVPATVALRNLWADLQEDKLRKLQRQAISQFERFLLQGHRSPFAKIALSPATRRRRQWRQEAEMLGNFGGLINPTGFSYFDYWRAKTPEASDEDEQNKKKIVLPVISTELQRARQAFLEKRAELNKTVIKALATKKTRRMKARRNV
ncbi:unnamed protein product [Calicophoron daubneyi]|uniref:Uncharacterized protein n=1 Tax=Calicophoron daubneyi TaxID=300641 RepID=A0AAV2TUR3_CALDB